jgi:hypothetical protein
MNGYVNVRHRQLENILLAEDHAEDGGLDPFERISCRVHRRWLHTCISSPVHVVQVSGHRWCRACSAPASVAVDELTGDVRVVCPRCGRPPSGRATQQIIRTCKASLAAAFADRAGGAQASRQTARDDQLAMASPACGRSARVDG